MKSNSRTIQLVLLHYNEPYFMCRVLFFTQVHNKCLVMNISLSLGKYISLLMNVVVVVRKNTHTHEKDKNVLQ